jgi:ribosome biogenesis GTPase / thiamine phosphate phosphatase
MPTLAELGLNRSIEAAFEAAREGYGAEPVDLGRITKIERGFAAVVGVSRDGLLHVPKALSKDPVTAPATGDWVLVSFARNVVMEVLPRSSCFVRRAAGNRREPQVVAANVDTLFVLMGLDKDFSLRRMERYLVLAEESRAAAVVFLTKAGVVEDAAGKITEAEASAHGVAVHAIDVVVGVNVEAPRRYLAPGRTVALTGSSGAGKSTLANFLLGAEVQSTGAVREHDHRGKHTTSRREIFVLPEGGAIIDTPGLRELAMWADADTFEHAFDDVVGLALGCRFTTCGHHEEPGCAIRAALADGTLSRERLASYRKLEEELRSGGRASSRPSRTSSRTRREETKK